MIDLPQKQILAILFAGGEAVEVSRVAQAIGADEETVLRYVPHLRDALADAGMPFEVLRLGDRAPAVHVVRLCGGYPRGAGIAPQRAAFAGSAGGAGCHRLQPASDARVY